jgi:branched-chain amino acid transport system permease protein
MEYLRGLLVNWELYLILALSLNLLVGYAGVVSLCHAALWGVGAYTAALLMLSPHFHLGLFGAMLGAMAVTMLLGGVVAIPSLRLKGDYFIIATVALQAIVYRALYNLDAVTRGPLGLTGIPPARIGGWSVAPESPWFLALTTVITGAVVLLFARLANSPFGRVLRALRDDEEAVAALGRSVAAFKVKAFLAGGAGAAVAGTLYAVRMGTLVPDQFVIGSSVLILTALIIGGVGNLAGPMVGAAVLVFVPELLRLLPGGAALAGEGRQVIFGLLLIVLLRVRPQGVAGVYRLG